VTASGFFIVIEGIDGCGKSEQVRRLPASLASECLMHVTAEPSRGAIGDLLRAYLHRDAYVHGWEAVAMLFAADRVEHLAREVEPALAKGWTVACDRYDASSIAYQGVTGSPVVVEWIVELNRHARRPDLTIILDLDPTVAQARSRSRGSYGERFDDLEFQTRVREGYRRLPGVYPDDRIVFVDATPDADTVHAEVLRVVREAIASR
jgi:dTMP kinase